jgi:tetratricopeptide (TPR) repeat protein
MSAAADALEILSRVQIAPNLIEDYHPLVESLEWRLSQLYWQTAGTAGFVRNEVPYTITSSGTLSAQAARVLFANCQEHRPSGAISVLEVGAGTGLFARLFLDEFERICAQAGEDFFSRLTYYVTDGSPATVHQWQQLGIFDPQRSVPGQANGQDPLNILTSEGPLKLANLRAVFSNYALDSLPATVLRKGAEGPEELQIRTHLTTDAERVKRAAGINLAELREMAERTDAKLLDYVQLFEFESAFRPPDRKYPYAEEALAFGHEWPRVILNSGAIDFLQQALDGLEINGFVLINDYGMTQPADASSLGSTQRFGSSAAMGLNFPFLAHHFSSRVAMVSRPAMDEKLPLHPMLLANRSLPQTNLAFHESFDWQAHERWMVPQETARHHIEAGRFDQAMHAYREALLGRPRDWALMGEIAEFLTRQVADYESARKMAEAALAVNPWYSVWLWNLLGDAVYAMDRFAEAHQHYLKAESMEPNDVRTALNLGYSYFEIGQPDRALLALARGLAADSTGAYRERLLEKQQQILAGIAVQRRTEQEWLARRAARLAS